MKGGHRIKVLYPIIDIVCLTERLKMTIKADRSKITDVDKDKKVILFNSPNHGKITGSRFSAVLGLDGYVTEFEAACNIARIYSEYESTKYTEAGEILEPVIRSYVRNNAFELLGEDFDLSSIDKIGVEEPVSKFDCGFDHFPSNRVFGGMVDGYIRKNGKRIAVLEIKTANDISRWVDDDTGMITKVPDNYMLQASLYAVLSGLDRIVFVVGFLNTNDYDDPRGWKPSKENCHAIVVRPMDLSASMAKASEWFESHIIGGVTPEWTDKDTDIIDYLTTKQLDFVPADLTKTINEYLAVSKELKPLKELEERSETLLSRQNELRDEIKMSLQDQISDDESKLEYHQGGVTFKLSLGQTARIDRDSMEKDGVLDRYTIKNPTVTLRISFDEK